VVDQPLSRTGAAVNMSLGSADSIAQIRIVVVYAILLAGNAMAWLGAWILFSDRPTLLGAAVLAYVLGLRHAVDADHIAAIDNVVRKLVQDGQKPVSAGFFFSLGHSTVVMLAVLAIAMTASAMHDQFGMFMSIGGVIGKTISATLLLSIGCANLIVLGQIWRTFQRARVEPLTLRVADMVGPAGGFLARLCGPVLRAVSKTWHMYPLGFLFGLSFDTATEVSLLGISAAQSGDGQSLWSILIFPALFAASMTLVDTTDGVLMMRAYGWALVNPVRKLWYNFTMTFASIAVASLVGGIQIVGLLVDHAGLDGALWRGIAGLGSDLTTFGFVIVGVFVATWSLSALVYRWQQFGVIPSMPRESEQVAVG
jgi:high-affinity nickel-transport protein